jgi:hypothetical protein
MTKLDAKRIRHSEDGRLSQKSSGPVFVSFEEAMEASALREVGEEVEVIALDPAIEISRTRAFEGEEQGEGDDLRGIKFGLGMFLKIFHFVINAAEKFYNEVGRGHGVVSPFNWFCHQKDRNNSVTFSTSTTGY